MKKMILSLSIAAALLSFTTVHAADKNPDAKVKQAFNKEFSQVKEVEWSSISKDGVFQAKFSFNNETVQAFFTEDGEYLGTTRQVTKSQLPIMVTNALDKQYSDARIVTIFEYSKTDGLAYYVTLVTSKGSMIVKATGSGDVSIYKKNIQ